jgi:hypothetical protein
MGSVLSNYIVATTVIGTSAETKSSSLNTPVFKGQLPVLANADIDLVRAEFVGSVE